MQNACLLENRFNMITSDTWALARIMRRFDRYAVNTTRSA